MLKTDCIYFDYEEDMGKSIPYCKVKKHKCTPCMCDTESYYIDDCDGCDRYVRKDYGFLKSLNRRMITSECCAYCIYRFECEDYNEEGAEQMVCYAFTGEEDSE